jgi:hypothetical protein
MEEALSEASAELVPFQLNQRKSLVRAACSALALINGMVVSSLLPCTESYSTMVWSSAWGLGAALPLAGELALDYRAFGRRHRTEHAAEVASAMLGLAFGYGAWVYMQSEAGFA